MYPMAARFDATVDKEMTVLSGGMHRDNLAAWYGLVSEQLLTPGWRESDLERVEPVFESFEGWNEPLSHCRSLSELPQNARRYIETIEKLAGCPIWLVSVGADREQTIVIKSPF